MGHTGTGHSPDFDFVFHVNYDITRKAREIPTVVDFKTLPHSRIGVRKEFFFVLFVLLLFP